MGLDLNKDYKTAKSKISAQKVTAKNFANEAKLKIENAGDNFEVKKDKILKQLDSIGDIKQRGQQQIKTQFDELVELFQSSMPENANTGNSSIDFLLEQLLGASKNTKDRIGKILNDEVIKLVGCSEEKTFVPDLKYYIKVKQVDITKLLKNNPQTVPYDLIYEKESVSNGSFPFPMNKELYHRLQNVGSSFKSEYGNDYIGASGRGILDIKYVTEYTCDGITYYGDFYEVTIRSRPNGNRISDFIRDYFGSIDVLDFDDIALNIMNILTGFIDISAYITTTENADKLTFERILQRILGLCFDTHKEIDVTGTAKLPELDNLDSSFFDMSPFDLRNINEKINNAQNGVTEFTDCDNVKVSVDYKSIEDDIRKLRQISSENENDKIPTFIDAIENLSKNPDWKIKIPSGVNIDLAIKADIIRIIPKAVMYSIITPKVLLGIMLGLKIIGSTIGDMVEDFKTFVSNFSRFIVRLMSQIGAIFVEELFKLLKKNIKILVDLILLEIIREAKEKRIQIISSVIFVLLQIASVVNDYRNCKNVIDEILKLLNLGLTQIGSGIPSFILASTSVLSGFSPIRALTNVVEDYQKLGIPTGDLPDGSPNIAIPAINAQIKGVYLENLQNGKTEIFIPPLAVAAFGGGTTLPSKGYGKTY